MPVTSHKWIPKRKFTITRGMKKKSSSSKTHFLSNNNVHVLHRDYPKSRFSAQAKWIPRSYPDYLQASTCFLQLEAILVIQTHSVSRADGTQRGVSVLEGQCILVCHNQDSNIIKLSNELSTLQVICIIQNHHMR
jgi:hypothetical protein